MRNRNILSVCEKEIVFDLILLKYFGKKSAIVDVWNVNNWFVWIFRKERKRIEILYWNGNKFEWK